MTRSTLCSTVLAISWSLALATAVQAQDPPEDIGPSAPAQEVPSRVSLEYMGVEGNWIRMDAFRAITADLQELRLLRSKTVPNLEETIAVLERRVNNVQAMRQLSDERFHLSEELTQEFEKRWHEAEARLDAWYRSPVFLLSAGVVLTVILQGAAVLIYKELSATSP